MFSTDGELIAFALSQWANDIETGDRAFSRNDISEMEGAIDERRLRRYTKVLSDEQLALVRRIRTLAEEQL